MEKDEQAIRKLIETWLAATRAGDVDTVLSLTTPDVVFLAPGQPPMQGQAAFGEALRAVLGKHVIESTSDIEEIVVSGDMAYCRSRLSMTVTSKHNNTPMARTGHTLSILRRDEDGNWRLARDANMIGSGA
ncbi:MAG: YybH family protein [Massilia sp.]